jgi:Fe-S-cluster containining protein
MLHKVSFLSEYNSGGGVCKYLVNNKCDIYAERPLICNIEKMYEDHFKETIGQNEFFMTNILACKELAVWFDDKENLLNFA